MDTSIPQNVVQCAFDFDALSNQTANSNTLQDIPRKQCTGPCGQVYDATPEFFYRDKTRKDGLQVLCKKCMIDYKKQHYKNNKEKINKKSKAYNEANKDALAEKNKRYYQKNKEEINRKGREYHQRNRNSILDKQKQYYVDNADRLKSYQKTYKENNRDKVRERQSRHYYANREHFSTYLREYRKKNLEVLRLREREYGRKNRDKKREYLKAYLQTEHGKMIRHANYQKRRALEKGAQGSYTAVQLQEQLKRQRRKCYYCHKKLGNGKRAWHADHIVPLSKGGTNYIDNIVITCQTCNQRKKDRLLHNWIEGGRLL